MGKLINNIIYFYLSAFLTGCFHEDCNTETKRINNLNYHFKITKNYGKDHSSWLDGVDSAGKINSFQYWSFHYLQELAQPGDSFLKDSGSLIFIVKKQNVSYILKWDCTSGGGLVDSIRPALK
jgi:hypothetical protein